MNSFPIELREIIFDYYITGLDYYSINPEGFVYILNLAMLIIGDTRKAAISANKHFRNFITYTNENFECEYGLYGKGSIFSLYDAFNIPGVFVNLCGTYNPRDDCCIVNFKVNYIDITFTVVKPARGTKYKVSITHAEFNKNGPELIEQWKIYKVAINGVINRCDRNGMTISELIKTLV